MHGEDDQICPFPTTGARSSLIRACRMGTPTTHAQQINADLLKFIQAG